MEIVHFFKEKYKSAISYQHANISKLPIPEHLKSPANKEIHKLILILKLHTVMWKATDNVWALIHQILQMAVSILSNTFCNVNMGSVAERSKALVLGTSLFGGVGSNPTAAKSIICQLILNASRFGFHIMKVLWDFNWFLKPNYIQFFESSA